MVGSCHDYDDLIALTLMMRLDLVANSTFVMEEQWPSKNDTENYSITTLIAAYFHDLDTYKVRNDSMGMPILYEINCYRLTLVCTGKFRWSSNRHKPKPNASAPSGSGSEEHWLHGFTCCTDRIWIGARNYRRESNEERDG